MTRSMRSSGFIVAIASDELVERVQSRGPKRFVLGKPLVGDVERFRPEPVELFPTLFALVHQVGALQRPQVLRDTGKRHREWRGERRRGYLSTVAQTHQNPASCRVTESAEDGVEHGVLMRNHMV